MDVGGYVGGVGDGDRKGARGVDEEESADAADFLPDVEGGNVWDEDGLAG